MSEPFIGEIRIFGFDFPPLGFALCDGQLLPIDQNQSLFSILGTTYGGDGVGTFALPDLRGRSPIHAGTGAGLTPRSLGQRGGAQNVTLSLNELPTHDHTVNAEGVSATLGDPGGNLLATAFPALLTHGPAAALVKTNPAQITDTGGGQAHANEQPFLTISFAIALQGVFPPRN